MYRNIFISDAYEDDGSCLLIQTLPYPLDHRNVLYLVSSERFEKKVELGLPPPFRKCNKPSYILGPVINGIACLYQNGKNVGLWNPTIDEFKVLPESPTELEPPIRNWKSFMDLVIRCVHYELDFIQNYSDSEDDDKDDYYYMSREDVWEIYSLRSNSWRKLDLDMPYGMYTIVGVYVYLNGVCHWWNEDHYDSYHEARRCLVRRCHLVSFDLSKEVFCKTHMPSTFIDNCDSRFEMRHLTVLNDHIALISYYNESATFHISIFDELGVKESWTKLFILGPFPDVDHPIGRKDNELVWFNLRTQMMEELGIKGQMHCCQVVIYKESHLPFL